MEQASKNNSALGWYTSCFKKYATFSGRARRREYWFFQLFNMIISGVLGLIFPLAMGHDGLMLALVFISVFTLVTFIPSISVLVRRLHDTNRSGWWCWIAVIPLVGAIILLVFLFSDSYPASNKYGENPKEAGTKSLS